MRRINLHQQRFACHFTMLLSMVNSGWRVMIGGEREYSGVDYGFEAGELKDVTLLIPELAPKATSGSIADRVALLGEYMNRRMTKPDHVFYDGVHVDHGKPHSMDECDERGCPR